MRSFIVMAMFVVSLAHAGWKDYEEVRSMELDADGLDRLSIDAGAGSMDVRGVAGLGKITVKAVITVPDADAEDAVRIIEKRVMLSLQRSGSDARLKALFSNGFMGRHSDSYIDLEVSVPQGLAVKIDDGSGSIDIVDILGDLTIEDGSGSIDIANVAGVNIDDGSGSIDVVGAGGDVFIVDGSGSIAVKHVQGSVTVDDGSGGITVSDVDSDLIIIDDGSGGLSFSNIRGAVEQEN